jgi:hypothetical protein
VTVMKAFNFGSRRSMHSRQACVRSTGDRDRSRTARAADARSSRAGCRQGLFAPSAAASLRGWPGPRRRSLWRGPSVRWGARQVDRSRSAPRRAGVIGPS